VIDTRNQLIARETPDARRHQEDDATPGRGNKLWSRDDPARDDESARVSIFDNRNGSYVHAPQRDPWRAQPYSGECREEYRREWHAPQRIDPSYIWGSCRN
jgi:hypothetical protein